MDGCTSFFTGTVVVCYLTSFIFCNWLLLLLLGSKVDDYSYPPMSFSVVTLLSPSLTRLRTTWQVVVLPRSNRSSRR